MARNRTEQALSLALTLTASQRAGRLVTEAGYECSAEQRAEITQAIERVLTSTVVGLRGPGPDVTAEELAVVVDEVAMHAVASVLGDPPARGSDLPN